jgi:hypothetical protein
MTEDNPASLSEEVSAMAEPWPKITALLGGTSAMRKAGETYLSRTPTETPEQYEYRRKNSTLYNAFERTVETMASKPFAEPLKPSEDMPPELAGVTDDEKRKTKPGWIDDIDLEGRDLQAFAHDCFRKAMAYGPAYILVDYPQVQGVRTLAEQRAANARPYFVLIDPQNVLGWRAARINGVQTLTQFRFKECVSEPVGRFGEKRVEQIRVLERTSGDDGEPARCWWEAWRQNDRGEWFLHNQGTISIGEIAVAPVYGKRTGFMTAKPPLLNLADLNLEHWASASHQTNILRTIRTPILFGSGMTDEDMNVVGNSAGKGVTVASELAKLIYVEPTAEGAKLGQESIEKIEEHMATMGMELLVSKPGAKTATEASIDTAENTSALSAMVQDLEDSIALALSFAAKWASLPTGGRVNLEGTFTALEPLDVQSLGDIRSKGNLSGETFFNELLRTGKVDENLTWEVEKQRLANDRATMVQTEGAKVEATTMAAAKAAPPETAGVGTGGAGTQAAEAVDFKSLADSIAKLVAAMDKQQATPAPEPAPAPDFGPLIDALKSQPAPQVTVNVPEQQPAQITVNPPAITVEAAQINIAPPAITVEQPQINVSTPPVNVTVQRGGEVQFETNEAGDITGATLT